MNRRKNDKQRRSERVVGLRYWRLILSAEDTPKSG